MSGKAKGKKSQKLKNDRRAKSDAIVEFAVDLLKEHGQMTFTDLVTRAKTRFKDRTDGQLRGALWNLHVKRNKEIKKADRGVFEHVDAKKKPVTESRKAEAEAEKAEATKSKSDGKTGTTVYPS